MMVILSHVIRNVYAQQHHVPNWVIIILSSYYGVLANLVYLYKLNWYLLLSKGFVTILWKKENEAAVSLLIILYAMIHDCRMTCAHTCVRAKASQQYSLATVAKQSLGMFNSTRCIHELLSILMLVRIHLGFRSILVVNDSWCLVIRCSKFNSTVHRMNEQRQAMVLMTNIYQNNIFVIRQQSPAL